MNDRYLYRAKRTDNGEWVEGSWVLIWWKSGTRGQAGCINVIGSDASGGSNRRKERTVGE